LTNEECFVLNIRHTSHCFNNLIQTTKSIATLFRSSSTSVCPCSYIVANAAWSRVFTEKIMTMVHSAGNVESVMSEVG